MKVFKLATDLNVHSSRLPNMMSAWRMRISRMMNMSGSDKKL